MGELVATKAKESKQVEKARKKLKLQIQEEHQFVTENALRKVSQDIKNWISRHSKERVKLRQTFSLFDENQHSEKTHSRYVKHLLQTLAQPQIRESNLNGRISKEG